MVYGTQKNVVPWWHTKNYIAELEPTKNAVYDTNFAPFKKKKIQFFKLLRNRV